MRKSMLYLVMYLALVSCSEEDGNSDAYGNFEAVEVMVAPEASGRIKSFAVKEGDKLEKGQVVGYIDTTRLHLQKMAIHAKKKAIRAQYGNIAGQINVLKQETELAEKDKKRIESLYEKGAATEKQMDDIKGRLDLLEKQIAKARAQNPGVAAELESLDIQEKQISDLIEKSVIVNPVDGTILEKYAEEYEIAGQGKPLYKIANLEEITLRAYISGSQLGEVERGQKVKVLIDKNRDEFKEYTGEIFWIASGAEFTPKIIQTKDVRANLVYAIKIRVNNDGAIKIGMPGEVIFD